MNNKKGISLIVLVITILVMIILAGVVIVSLQNDNPINKAKFAKMVDSVQSIRGSISQYTVTAQANSSDNQSFGIDYILTKTANGANYAKLGNKDTTGYLVLNAAYKVDNAANSLVHQKTVKQLLGVDPTQVASFGYFLVNRKTGASEFVLNSDAQTMAGENALPDGIVKAPTMPLPTGAN